MGTRQQVALAPGIIRSSGTLVNTQEAASEIREESLPVSLGRVSLVVSRETERRATPEALRHFIWERHHASFGSRRSAGGLRARRRGQQHGRGVGGSAEAGQVLH